MELIKANNPFLNIPVYDIDRNRSSMQVTPFEPKNKIKKRYSCLIDPDFCKCANEDKKFYVEIDKSKDKNIKQIESKPKGRISQMFPDNIYSPALHKRHINLEYKKKKGLVLQDNTNSIYHKNASNLNIKKIDDDGSDSKSSNLKVKNPKVKSVSKFKNQNVEKSKDKDKDKDKDKNNDKSKDKSNEKSIEKICNKNKNIQKKNINKNNVSFNDVSCSLPKSNNKIGNKKDNKNNLINKEDPQYIDNNILFSNCKSSKERDHQQEAYTSKHKDHPNSPKILNINIFQSNPKHKSDNRRSTHQKRSNQSSREINIDESKHKKKTNKDKRKNKKSTFQVTHENFITYPINIEIRPSKSKFDVNPKNNEDIDKDKEKDKDRNKSSSHNILIEVNNEDNKQVNVDDIDNSNEIIINKAEESIENKDKHNENKQNMKKSEQLVLNKNTQHKENIVSNKINDDKEENKSKNSHCFSDISKNKGNRLNLSFNNGGNRPSIKISSGSGLNYDGKKENEIKKKPKKFLFFCCIPFEH